MSDHDHDNPDDTNPDAPDTIALDPVAQAELDAALALHAEAVEDAAEHRLRLAIGRQMDLHSMRVAVFYAGLVARGLPPDAALAMSCQMTHTLARAALEMTPQMESLIRESVKLRGSLDQGPKPKKD